MQISNGAATTTSSGPQNQERNEIKEFVECRYISATEAFWRLFSFSMHEEYPAHQRLAIHLPDEQIVVYEDDDSPDEVVTTEPPVTTLLGWFAYNEAHSDGRDKLYADFPLHFVWDKTQKQWRPRRQRFGGTIGRIYAVSPRESEKFHLRMLLYHVPGAKSFTDIRTVDNREYSTFKAAAGALGLLADDNEWDACLNEAVLFPSPSQLRHLFGVIFLFCDPSNPHDLWLKYRNAMSEDYIHQIASNPGLNSLTDDDAYDICLLDLSDSLESNGVDIFSFSDFARPTHDKRSLLRPFDRLDSAPRLVREQMTYVTRAAELPDPALLNFNDDQRNVYDSIMSVVNNGIRNDIETDATPKVFFIDGPGGTGKTFLFNAMLNSVRKQGGIALAVASSGTAAILLEGGRTAHSRFKIPLDTHGESFCNIKPRSVIADLLKMTKLIVWDECSMISRFTLEAVDRTFKDVFKSVCPALQHVPFGGRVLVFGGDFRQVLPVVPKGSRSDIVDQCINRSRLWSSVQTLRLTINMRVQQAQVESNDDLARTLQNFSDLLIRIGNGAEETLPNTDRIRLPSEWCLQANSTMALSDWVFSDITATDIPPLQRELNWLSTKAILTPKNKDVSKINSFLLEKFPGTSKKYLSSDVAISEDSQIAYSVEFLNSIESGGIPDHKLKLKLGCPVILLRNLDPERGLCNGTRLICKSFKTHVIEATIATGAFENTTVLIPRITCIPTDSQSPIPFRRRQFPLRLAFCMTIHKAQGQTLDRMGLFLPEPVFSHGQLHVALSRVKSPSALKIITRDCSTDNANNDNPIYTSNVVYSEIF